MVNSQVMSEISNALKIDERVEKIPAAIPVIEVGLKSIKNMRSLNTLKNVTGGGTAITMPTGKDIYIVGFCLAIIKDAACDLASATNMGAYVTISGQPMTFCGIPALTLTAQASNQELIFTHPIKIDRDTNVTWSTNAFAAGNLLRSLTIYFVEDEVS